MTTEKLIIDGVDHAKFDLEWAKRGGVVMLKKHLAKVTYVCNISDSVQVAQTLGQKAFNGESFANVSPQLLRMATPDECKAAGIEYIDPPIRWLQIDSAPEDGRIIEVADFRVVVANECPLSKHWKFWRDIPHPFNKNSMTQPPKDE